MLQIKTFIGREDHTSELDDAVNTWIAESGAKVVSITGNIAPQSILPGKDSPSGTPGRRFAPSDLFVLVTYEKG